MKTLIKFIVSLLVGIALIVVGIILGGFSNLDQLPYVTSINLTDFHITNAKKTEDKDIIASQSIYELNITVYHADIKFIEYNEKEIKVVAQNIYDDFILEAGDHELTIKQPHHILNNEEECDITIYIPENYQFNTVNIDMSAGKCEIHQLNASTMNLKQGMGEIIVDDGSANDLIIDGGLGRVEVNDFNLKNNLEIDIGFGEADIELTDNVDLYTHSVNVSFGSVVVGDIDYSGISSTKNENKDSRHIEIDCGFGSVEVKGG